MAKEKLKVKVLENIETNLNEITNVEKYISKIVGNESFDRLNNIVHRQSENTGYNFVSLDINLTDPYVDLITEEEFLQIVQANTKRVYKSAGRYQEMLFSHYMQAKKENDEGYISDVLNKAITFRDNVVRIQMLMRDKTFMKEWRKNFGKITPLYILKNTGSMNKIDIIERYVE